jgi:hypothetical protein
LSLDRKNWGILESELQAEELSYHFSFEWAWTPRFGEKSALFVSLFSVLGACQGSPEFRKGEASHWSA